MSDGTADSSQKKAECNICSRDLSPYPGEEFVFSYPNFVCGYCDSEAVTENGTAPRHFSMADSGDNPVFIRDIKCWRRYRFGGYVTMRDLHDCKSIEEFYARNKRRRERPDLSPDSLDFYP